MAKHHGFWGTPEHRIWVQMKQRCLNPRNKRFKYYGGRGIKICQRWVDSFEDFLADVGRRPAEGLTLDRVENDEGYFPGNVRWTDWGTQSSNRRTAVMVVLNGTEMTATQASLALGLRKNSVSRRLRAGASMEKALTRGFIKDTWRGRRRDGSSGAAAV